MENEPKTSIDNQQFVPAATAIAEPFIAEQEGFRANPYKDEGGTWTIGYGFTYTPDDGPVDMLTEPMTEAQAAVILTSIVASTMERVVEMVYVQLNAHQIAALTSFAYNEGTEALATSALLHYVNTGDFKSAKACFASWVYSKGRVLLDLVKRRKLEAEMFLPANPVVTA